MGKLAPKVFLDPRLVLYGIISISVGTRSATVQNQYRY